MLLWYNITLFICLFLCICTLLLLYVVKIYVSFFSGCRAEENVTQPTEDVMAVEGQPTTLTCIFDKTYQSPNLFWYKQQPNGKPMFMLRRDKFSHRETTTEFKDRFDARLNVTAKSVPLTIQRVQLSDSAVYYCALRPTVTTGYTAPLQKL
uniref:Ig-like domain-containing protein n=1 Tax=Hucho hucho TaxID=62062 RepID=A0A4W5M674_9TELE